MTSTTRSVLSALALSAALLAAPNPAAAWFSTGHMIVAQIAYDRLDPEVRTKVDRLIGVLGTAEPAISAFVPAATWMDGLPGQSFYVFGDWHFINAPINAGGLAAVPAADDDNVVWAIRQAATTLGSDAAGDFEKALALRFLIHLTGDVHQPLHSSNRYSERHPAGDRGGNSFALTEADAIYVVPCRTDHPIPPTTINQLHALWDNTLGLYAAIDPLVNPELAPCIPQFAADVEAQVPLDAAPAWTDNDPNNWAQESFTLASTTVYEGIEEGGTASDAYLAAGRPLVRQRLAVAGYRLGALLNCLLGADDSDDCITGR